jgi:hypothetical protein
MNMNWKQWKLGLLVAILTGIGTGVVSACIALALNCTNRQIVILFASNLGIAIGKDMVLFLQQHPADSIDFDTTHITKTVTTESTVKTPSATVADVTKPEENK